MTSCILLSLWEWCLKPSETTLSPVDLDFILQCFCSRPWQQWDATGGKEQDCWQHCWAWEWGSIRLTREKQTCGSPWQCTGEWKIHHETRRSLRSMIAWCFVSEQTASLEWSAWRENKTKIKAILASNIESCCGKNVMPLMTKEKRKKGKRHRRQSRGLRRRHAQQKMMKSNHRVNSKS